MALLSRGDAALCWLGVADLEIGVKADPEDENHGGAGDIVDCLELGRKPEDVGVLGGVEATDREDAGLAGVLTRNICGGGVAIELERLLPDELFVRDIGM